MSVENRIVSEDEADLRLDRWFRRHFPNLTQGGLQKLCRKGQVRVDGKRVQANHRLFPGQTIRVPPLPDQTRPPPPPPPNPALIRRLKDMILYEDDQLIVLNKPSGLATQGGPGIIEHVDMMLEGLRPPGGERPRLVHRIDRDTSGLLLLARTPGVAAKLAASFRSREVTKTYWAVVVGRPTPEEGMIDQPLVKVGAGGAALVIPSERGEEDAVSAKSAYETLDAAGKRFSWLALSPLTGRTHQLRVHCESLGTPILGDPRYGGKKAHPDGFMDRLHLHARALEFPHPAGGSLSITAPLPSHMMETFRMLGFIAKTTPPPKRKR
ncbi:RluA family pseudouridine synthase [Saccharibacter sp. 17.LH.SD]|uniref:RluA family pseudouridine synthase n=1 Tax=Saccharibacter sp. 17.LH.SD TaxID=2689393 RepID=UPI00136DC6DE|nr:RluA family pseudouridine synthase [Saccharibacter sp. 17.LH.SD]MXV43963.1 RluA family pseudouridine synthase [Saccharibacter sp. 17.LH.SD]